MARHIDCCMLNTNMAINDVALPDNHNFLSVTRFDLALETDTEALLWFEYEWPASSLQRWRVHCLRTSDTVPEGAEYLATVNHDGSERGTVHIYRLEPAP